MNALALENQKNTIEYYIDELNKIYKSLDDEVYKFTYEEEQYINEEFLDTNLLDLMKKIIFLIDDYSKRFAFNYGYQGINSYSDMDDLYFERYQKQEKITKIIYNNQLEIFWNQIPTFLKEIYILTHVSQKGIDKKEIYTRFIRSIYILTNSDKKLSVHYFIRNLDFSKLFTETERFILDKYNNDDINQQDFRTFMFDSTRTNKKSFIEHLQTHIFLLYYNKYIGIKNNKKRPLIFGKLLEEDKDNKKYFDRIDDALSFL